MTDYEKVLFIVANDTCSAHWLGIRTGMSPEQVHDVYKKVHDEGLYRKLSEEAIPYRVIRTNHKKESFTDRFVRLMKEPLQTKSIRAIAKEMGINEDAVAKYLKGVHVPRANKVIQIAEYFGVKPSWLLNGDD